MRLSLGTTEITLLAERAVWHEASRSLIVADVHVGKSAAFRARGLAVPEGETEEDLARLSSLLLKLDAAALVVAGDLFHAAEASHHLPRVAAWLESLHPRTTVTLVEGNHDRRAKALSQSLGLKVVSRLRLGGFDIRHDPADLRSAAAGLAGHLHPGMRLANGPRHSLRTSCFWLRAGRHLILPSFGTFTGSSLIEPKRGDRVFLPIRDRVAEWPVE